MPVESTLSTKELRKTWTGKSSRARAFSRKPKNFHCSHPAKVLSVSADEFKAQCSDKSVWDIEIQSKRTGFNPKGNWAASGASAAAFEASDEDL